MPKSKGRAKKSKGKAWRTGRAGSEYDEGVVDSPGTDLSLMPDGMAEVLSNALAEVAEEYYSDVELGRILIRRGWLPVHDLVEDVSSDMWSWQPSTPGGDSWVSTIVIVQEHGYLVQYADFQALMRGEYAEYDSREELLDDLEVIEAYRHPADPRS